MSLRVFGQGEPFAGLSSGQVKYAIGMATAAITSFVLSHALHLSGGYWSVLSAVIVFRFDFGNTLGASRDRLLGTIAGALFTVSLLSLARLWSIADLLLLTAIIAPLSFLTALRPQYRTALVTSIIVLSAGGPSTAPFTAAGGRILAVGLGALIGGLFSFILSFVKHPEVGRDPAAKIILGLGGLLPFSREPGDTGRTAHLQRDIYTELQGFSSNARRRNPGAAPIVRILTRVYWDIIFVGRIALSTPNLDKPDFQAALGQVEMSFQHLCIQTAENIRDAKPLPKLIDFEEACRHMEGLRIDDPLLRGQEENAIVSLLQLLRQDFEALLGALA